MSIYTVNGFQGTLVEVAERFGVNYCILRDRLAAGLSMQEAVNGEGYVPLKINRKQWNGFYIQTFDA